MGRFFVGKPNVKKRPAVAKAMAGEGGEGGIRTLDTLLEYTHFPGVLFRPLRHLSGKIGLQR